MNSNVFTTKISSDEPLTQLQLTSAQEREVLSELFEQLLIFDRITIRVDRTNFALFFLVRHLGINLVEELIERGIIQFLLWTPVMMTGGGRRLEDGKIDDSSLIGQPPIFTGQLSQEDLDPTLNISRGLARFDLHRERRRIFTRKALKNYVLPNGMEFSGSSAEFVIDAYKSDNLKNLGLPFGLEPDQLTMIERRKLLQLGTKVLETSVLAKYELMSLDNYEHIKIGQANFDNIGKAYNVTQHTSELFKIENLPDLKRLYLLEGLDFRSIFELRNLVSAKYFRKWIKSISGDSNVNEVTEAYLNEIKGKTKYFETGEGKFIKSTIMFAVGAALGAIISGPIGATAAGFALSKLDTFWIDSVLKGKKPSMFIDDVKLALKDKELA